MKGGALEFVREQIVLADGRRLADAIGDDRWIETRMLKPVFATGPDGLPLHRLVYLELPRGHWKSGGAAAIALAEALRHASTDVVVAAADRDQASIVLDSLDGYLLRNPALGSLVRTRGDERLADNGSRVRVISSDAPTSWGLGGTHRRFRVIADELTAWPKQDLWTSLASATGKVDDAQTIVLSNAGFAADACWQWNVRAAAEREPWGYLYSTDGPVASWIRPGWVEQMRGLLPPAAFERVILNRWSSVEGDFVTAAQWSRCVDPLLRPSRGGPGVHFLGIDLGLKRDRTALAVVHREGGETVLDELLTFAGTRQSPVSISAVERAIEELHTRFPRLQALADPWQMHATMERLRARGLTIDEHVFSAGSVGRLSATLYEAIASGRLRVFADEELEREVLALRVVYSPTGWRMDHRAGAFSDRAVALALAVQAAGQERYATQLPSYGSVGPSLLEDLGGGFDDGSGRLDPSITYDFKF